MNEASETRGHLSRPRAAGLGLLAGVLNGLIVLGGGVLITPLLFVTGVRPQIAIGTSLAALTMLSCIGFSAHLLLDGIALGLVPIVAAVLGGAVGSMIGSKILARLTPPWMLMLFAIVRVPVAVRLIDQGLGTALLGTVIPSGAPLRPMRLSVCSLESSPAASVAVVADSSCSWASCWPAKDGPSPRMPGTAAARRRDVRRRRRRRRARWPSEACPPLRRRVCPDPPALRRSPSW